MKVAYREKAITQLQRLTVSVRKRIVDKIDFFATQDDPLHFAKSLVGYDAYRFRVGDYRVIFDLENETIVVLLVVKRAGAYKNL